MRTVPTLCASGAGVGIASVGLAVVREETFAARQHSSRDPSPSVPEMTAVAAYPQPSLHSPFSFTTPQSARSVSEGPNGKARSSNVKRVGEKRKLTLTPRTSFSLGMERAPEREDEIGSQADTPSAQPHSWLRRFSSGMSISRESSQTSVSRPGSAAVSQSNGSVAFSHAGSTTPMFPNSSPAPLPPNKLVKRASSVRSSSNGTPPSGSRLPIPVFRRPATSHQRSVTLQERFSGISTDQNDQMSLDEKSSHQVEPPLRHYFVPKVAGLDESTSSRRRISGIPNPIKRIYPDRKYKPILVSANHNIKPSQVGLDNGMGGDEQDHSFTPKFTMGSGVLSSPLPSQTNEFEESSIPRRSFSISDLLSTGPQPLWRRPSSSKGKHSGSKLVRRGRQRVTSAPHDPMGSALSRGTDSEPPAKRRDLTDPLAAQRSIYSSSGSNHRIESNANHEIQLNLGGDTPRPFHGDQSISSFAESPIHTQTPSPLENRRLPSANQYSTAARPGRVSTAQSEITSTVDSDSEYRSIGDASTDYQSDAVYDSYPTRTTRSSSGMRGPHIETIFDESPPNFSSGGSTRLKDILNEGASAKGEHFGRYRHSTIEEEESFISTPVRSLHDKSVTSTPSARPGAHLFTSSPPATLPTMPDPDEIDWDAPDDEPSQAGLGIEGPSSAARSHPVERSLPFQFGPALRQPQQSSADTKPHRPNGTNADRTNLFDWAEVQPSPSQNNSPPRPRTVHGKKNQESRGSRPSGRRPPSGMHARSHSVPVVPDVDGKRNNVTANKFGTWGVGSKVVTEDWNEDFDFEEQSTPLLEDVEMEDKRIDSGHEMFVPRSIREQQENVVANISLLREWGLLIEELKELRMRAVTLDMVKGSHAQAFQEVDAMIELADQETEEQTLAPRRSPPSSPGFDESAFDEPLPNIAGHTGPGAHPIDLPDLMEEDDAPSELMHTSIRPTTPPHILTGRPRRDSEAVARSVIDAIQSRRSVSEPTANKPVQPPKKVPFDTATLRHIVPYVKDLKRKIKDALRETEGLYSSPRRRTSASMNHRDDDDDDDDEPAFRSMFNEPHSEHDIARRRSRREQAATDHYEAEDFPMDQRGDLAQRMQDMNLPHK